MEVQTDNHQKPTVAVCMIVENLPVPADRRVWQEARALTKSGYQVSIICPKGHGFELSRETRDDIEIYRHRTWEASGKFGYLLEYCWAMSAEFLLAVRIYSKTRFRILQACNPPDTIFLIALFFKLLGVRFVFDHHDPAPELYTARFAKKDFVYRLLRVAERLSFRTADVVISTSDSLKHIAAFRGGVRPEKSFLVRGCPDLNDFAPRRPNPELKKGRSHLVLYVGVMGSQDGVDLLLDSIEYLVKTKHLDDTLFVMIGPGTELPRLKVEAIQRDLTGCVMFTGPLYGQALLDYLAVADVGVSPDPCNDLNHKLSMLKIMEYMAFSLPTVLYDLIEGRRIAADAALYAKPNDIVDFADRIAELLDSPSLRHRLGSIGRNRVEEGLNWDSQKQVFLKAYRAALDPSMIF
jgi:glycosyltransferase involved in cell wall biosynthesis